MDANVNVPAQTTTGSVGEDKVQRALNPPSEQTLRTVYVKGVGYRLANSMELSILGTPIGKCRLYSPMQVPTVFNPLS